MTPVEEFQQQVAREMVDRLARVPDDDPLKRKLRAGTDRLLDRVNEMREDAPDSVTR